jgi:hypothetical protein
VKRTLTSSFSSTRAARAQPCSLMAQNFAYAAAPVSR